MSHHIVIVGGGTAGISIAARLDKKVGGKYKITIIEPSDIHYNQSAFTLVGAGVSTLDKTHRREAILIPSNVIWEFQRVVAFEPENNQVKLNSGNAVNYDALVVCTGLELNWELIRGAKEALGKYGVCSIYSPHLADYTWNCIENLGAGSKLVFTQPKSPFKYPGGPQEIAFLAADSLRKRKILQNCKLHFMTYAGSMFEAPYFNDELNKIVTRYGIKPHFHYKLIDVDGPNKTAVFHVVAGKNQGKKFAIEFNMLHITPPQSPPDVVKNSALADDAGYVDVHPHTLQHTRYSNVFSLGDVCSTPGAKTASAIREQASVVTGNILDHLNGESTKAEYDGYSFTSLSTAYGKAMFAEYGFDGEIMPTFKWNSGKELRLNWWMKLVVMPVFYWYYMLKGYDWLPGHNRNSGAQRIRSSKSL